MIPSNKKIKIRVRRVNSKLTLEILNLLEELDKSSETIEKLGKWKGRCLEYVTLEEHPPETYHMMSTYLMTTYTGMWSGGYLEIEVVN